MDSPPAMPVYALPIAQRRSMPWTRFFKAILFTLVFDIACLMINCSQFIFLLPLRILPFRWAKNLYNSGIRYTKGAFGCLQSALCSFVIKDDNGNAVALDLPTKFVLIANHQVSSGSAETSPSTNSAPPRSMQTGGMPGVLPTL